MAIRSRLLHVDRTTVACPAPQVTTYRRSEMQTTSWIRVRSAANNQSLIPTPQFIAASASNLQDYFAVHGKNPPAYTSTLLKSDLLSGLHRRRVVRSTNCRTALLYSVWWRFRRRRMRVEEIRRIRTIWSRVEITTSPTRRRCMAAMQTITRSMSREGSSAHPTPNST